MRKFLLTGVRLLTFAMALQPIVSEAEDNIDKALRGLLAAELRTKGPATIERVMNQDEVQRACSTPGQKLPAATAKKIETAQLAAVRYPADGNYLGKWEEGEKIAQSGRGLQSSDAVGAPNGGNCYACHQIRKEEIAYGTIGPSLYQYGKLRGSSEPVLRYTWAKMYNSQAFNACSNMPRFGHQQILTEQQLRDVMALLMDPASPVNK
jgi:L-cysteine S-thiosulfotransferase